MSVLGMMSPHKPADLRHDLTPAFDIRRVPEVLADVAVRVGRAILGHKVFPERPTHEVPGTQPVGGWASACCRVPLNKVVAPPVTAPHEF